MLTTLILSFGLLLYSVTAGRYWLLVCILMSMAFPQEPVAPAEREGGGERGLTAEELERLEEGKMAVGGREVCAVCCDEMEEAQAARVLPRCCHAFHRCCADAWLQRQPTCPLCRARMHPSQPQSQPQHQPQ